MKQMCQVCMALERFVLIHDSISERSTGRTPIDRIHRSCSRNAHVLVETFSKLNSHEIVYLTPCNLRFPSESSVHMNPNAAAMIPHM